MMTANNKSKTIKRIIVVSSSTETSESCYLTGWQSALILAEQLRGMAIEIVHLCQPCNNINNVITVDEQQLAFHHQLSISEKALMAKTQGSFTLANQFIGWQQQGQSFFHADAPAGLDFDRIEFQHNLTRLQLESSYKPKVDDFSISAACAKQGTFSHPVNGAASIKSSLTYRIKLA